MAKDQTKSKAALKAKRVAKLKKQGQTVKSHKTHTSVRFYKPKTLKLARTPKYAKSVKSLTKNTNNFDKFAIIKNPVTTEKAMKRMEDENTLVFIVGEGATKSKIKMAFDQLYKAKVRSVNTLIRPDGKKKAYIRLAPTEDALNIANTIGFI